MTPQHSTLCERISQRLSSHAPRRWNARRSASPRSLSAVLPMLRVHRAARCTAWMWSRWRWCARARWVSSMQGSGRWSSSGLASSCNSWASTARCVPRPWRRSSAVVRESDWLGTGGFKNFLREVLDGNVRLSLTPPGYVYDSRRHKALNHLSELREPMRDLVQRQYVVVGLPRLHPHRRAVRRRGPSTK